jgi:hypothetical protein
MASETIRRRVNKVNSNKLIPTILLAAFAMMMIRKGVEGWRGYCAEMNDGSFLLALSAIDD